MKLITEVSQLGNTGNSQCQDSAVDKIMMVKDKKVKSLRIRISHLLIILCMFQIKWIMKES